MSNSPEGKVVFDNGIWHAEFIRPTAQDLSQNYNEKYPLMITQEIREQNWKQWSIILHSSSFYRDKFELLDYLARTKDFVFSYRTKKIRSIDTRNNHNWFGWLGEKEFEFYRERYNYYWHSDFNEVKTCLRNDNYKYNPKTETWQLFGGN